MTATLARTVRFGWPSLQGGTDPLQTPRGNTLVGWPGLGPSLGLHGELTVEVEGEPDPRTGYLVGIDRIDAAVRSVGLARLAERLADGPPSAIEATRILHEAVATTLDVAVSATILRLERCSGWRIESSHMSMPVVLRRYEFSASHRLHLPELDDAANRELFGKCSNPNGHGHNYEVEIQVAFASDPDPGAIHRLDEVVNRTVLDRFDHKHLNLDLDDFRDRVASVENIAARIVDLLREPVERISSGASLRAATVWETARTACTIHA